MLSWACTPAREPESPAVLPTRTAAADRDLRQLAVDIARAQACERVEGRFLPLPADSSEESTAPPVIEGRLRPSECRAELVNDDLAITLEGRGFRWTERSSPGPLGSSFTVRGTLRFEAMMRASLAVDLRYDRSTHRAVALVTPIRPPSVSLTPLGEIPVVPDGGWSSIVGGVGGWFGEPLQERARPMVEREGAALVRRQLNEGATLGVDLCSGQLGVEPGQRGDGSHPPPPPFDDEHRRWFENLRVRVGPEGLDVSGPWPVNDAHPLVVDIEVSEGPGVQVCAVCEANGVGLVESYLAGTDLPALRTITAREALPGRRVRLDVERAPCERVVFVARHLGGDTPSPTLYRFRIRPGRQEAAGLIDCAQ